MPPKSAALTAAASSDMSVIGAPSSPVPHAASGTAESSSKKKKHRAGRKHRKNRRQSFAAPSENEDPSVTTERPSLEDVPEHPSEQHLHSFYRQNRASKSNESLESEMLLDHREVEQAATRQRRSSIYQSNTRPSQIHRQSTNSRPGPKTRASTKSRDLLTGESEEEDEPNTDRTPLLGQSSKSRTYGGPKDDKKRRPSTSSSRSGNRLRKRKTSSIHSNDYDVNNPPSVPGSPTHSDEEYDDVMLPEFGRSPHERRKSMVGGREAVIDIDEDFDGSEAAGFESGFFRGSPRSPILGREDRRRSMGTDDVCVPYDNMTEGGDEEDFMQQHDGGSARPRRSRKREWPDLSALEEFSLEEKEERELEGVTRAKRVSEPVLIGGRLRPQKGGWRRDDAEEHSKFRWTYFNEELDSSLRSHSLSGLQDLGFSLRELFIPDQPIIDESSDSEDESPTRVSIDRSATPVNGNSSSRSVTRQSSILDHKGFEAKDHAHVHTHKSSDSNSPSRIHSTSQSRPPKPKRFGPRPIFWLDIYSPKPHEMKALCRAFGIHKLTAEDIMEQEAREKVELFRNYYFVNYRTFEQDPDDEDYMDPVNMYFVVFKGGVLSFHFSLMPHPANVRRRIRQLAEHQYTDSDWISYAIIDNITDAYAPVIEQIEQEVDEIDDDILAMHRVTASEGAKEKRMRGEKSRKKRASVFDHDTEYEKLLEAESDAGMSKDSGKDMLLRVGECRKKVMSLYRLLGNKADVIKGLAKRCNEQWSVAPTSDVGLYLGDIQVCLISTMRRTGQGS